MRRRSLALVPVTLLAIAIAACGPSAPARTEGQQLLVRTVDRALVLQSVTVHAELEGAGGLLGGPTGATLDAALDLEHTSAHVTGRSTEAAAKPIEVTVKDGVWWIDSGAGVQKLGGGMLPVPAGDDLRSAITGFATDPRIPVVVADGPCAIGTCKRLTADVPPQVLWDHFSALVRTLYPLPNQLPPNAPTAHVIVDVDPATFDPVHAEIQATVEGIQVRLTVEASGFDQPVTIQPPA